MPHLTHTCLTLHTHASYAPYTRQRHMFDMRHIVASYAPHMPHHLTHTCLILHTHASSSYTHMPHLLPDPSCSRVFDSDDPRLFHLYHYLQKTGILDYYHNTPQILAPRSFLGAGFDTRWVPRRFMWGICKMPIRCEIDTHASSPYM